MTDDELRIELLYRLAQLAPDRVAVLRRELSLYQQALQFSRDEHTHNLHIRRVVDTIVTT